MLRHCAVASAGWLLYLRTAGVASTYAPVPVFKASSQCKLLECLSTLQLSVPRELELEGCRGIGVSFFWHSLESHSQKVCHLMQC